MKIIGLLGGISLESTATYYRIIGNRAEGIILGCTAIEMLISQNNTDMRFFDTTDIHAKRAVSFSLAR